MDSGAEPREMLHSDRTLLMAHRNRWLRPRKLETVAAFGPILKSERSGERSDRARLFCGIGKTWIACALGHKACRDDRPLSAGAAAVRWACARAEMVATPAPSKGCLSNKTALAMIFKLAEAAGWWRRDGHNQLLKIVLGVMFTGGIKVARS
jgi:hypothetical protein